MKKLFIRGAFIASAVAVCACSGTQKDTSAETEKVVRNGIEYIYDSPEAAAAPEYIAKKEIEGPLALIESYNPNMTPTDIDFVDMWNYNKRKIAKPMLMNISQDTVEIESIQFPDSRFEAKIGTRKLIPRLAMGLELYADTTYAIEDYRFIVTYRDKKYPDQTFHVNIYPDKDALNAAKARRK